MSYSGEHEGCRETLERLKPQKTFYLRSCRFDRRRVSTRQIALKSSLAETPAFAPDDWMTLVEGPSAGVNCQLGSRCKTVHSRVRGGEKANTFLLSKSLTPDTSIRLWAWCLMGLDLTWVIAQEPEDEGVDWREDSVEISLDCLSVCGKTTFLQLSVFVSGDSLGTVWRDKCVLWLLL